MTDYNQLKDHTEKPDLDIEIRDNIGYAATTIKDQIHVAITSNILELHLLEDIKNNKHFDYTIDTIKKCLTINYMAYDVVSTIVIPFKVRKILIAEEEFAKLMKIKVRGKYIYVNMKKNGIEYCGTIYNSDDGVTLKILKDIKSGKHNDYIVTNKFLNEVLIRINYYLHNIKVYEIITLTPVEKCVIL